MSDRVIECASRAGRDFSEFMKGEKGMMEALASVDEFGEQLRLNGCVNHHFVSYMMRNSIMQAFMDMAKAERKEERRRKRLQVAATCAKSTTGASGMGDGESPRLTADAELNYYRLRSGIDRITAQVNYLQEYIRTQCLK